MDYTIRLIALLAFCARLKFASSLANPPPLLIKDESYTIWCEIEITNSNSSSRLEVAETYSHWQDRSVLKYRTVSRSHGAFNKAQMPEEGVAFADHSQLLVKSEHECKRVDSRAWDEFIGLNAFDISNLAAIVGPSRALHLMSGRLANFRSRLQSCSLGEKTTLEPFVLYNYDLGQTQATLYYYETAINLPRGLPFKIVLYVGKKTNSIVAYHFKRIVIHPDEPIFSSTDSLVSAFQARPERDVIYDALAMEPKFGCGSDMSLLSKEGNTNPLLAAEFRFSFQAKVSLSQRPESVFFNVAYEPSIKILRVDKLEAGRVTQTLVDYRAGELYHAFSRRFKQDPLLDGTMHKITADFSRDISCIRMESPQIGNSLGAMLLGATKVSYLGLAQVRGIETRAYLAMSSSLPWWLNQPFKYQSADSNSATEANPIRNADSGQRAETQLVTVFYLTNSVKQNPLDEFSGQLVHIEVLSESKLATGQRIFSQVASVSIFDFSWHLAHQAPNGQPIEQFFSLADSCVSPATEDNHYAELNLFLERNWPLERQNEAEWLHESRRRNFALRSMMQKRFNLPASMIYDINSRLVRGPLTTSGSLAQSYYIESTMRAVEHKLPVTKLIRLARGTYKRPKRRPEFRFQSHDLQSCCSSAAHLRFDAIVLWSPHEMWCNVFQASELDAQAMSLIVDFESEQKDVQVYRIEHITSKIGARGDELTQLAQSGAQSGSISRVELMNEDTNDTFDMMLKWMNLRELDRKVPVEMDEVEFVDSDKFVGIGLVAEEASEINRLIEPDPFEALENGDERAQKLTELTTQMTVGWCQAECLADFECRSYSTCLRDSKVECVLSKVDFRSPYMLTQLAQLRSNKTRASERVRLRVDRLGDKNAEVPVRKRPNCELRNKSYRDLFIEAKKSNVDVLRRRLHPVSGREQCAKLCFEVTIETLKSEVLAAHKINENVYRNPGSHVTQVKAAFDALKNSNRNLCSTFFYLDRMQLLALTDGVRLELERIAGLAPSDGWAKNGFCILDDKPSEQEAARLRKSTSATGSVGRLELLVERFAFDFSSMFEKHHGVSLAGSGVSVEFRKSLIAVDESRAQEKDFALVWEHLSRGDNIEIMSYEFEPRDCLRKCFLQTSRLWPACKSVDFFEMNYKHGTASYCFYNSRTLRELLLGNRTDLIYASTSEQRRMMSEYVARIAHYEPKPGFVGESLGLLSDLEIRVAEIESVAHHLDHSVIRWFSLMLTILLASTFGLFIGLLLARRILATAGSRPGDAQRLVRVQNDEPNSTEMVSGSVGNHLPAAV